MHQHIAQLTSFVDRSRRGDRDMAGDTAPEWKTAEQLTYAGPVQTDLGIDLAVCLRASKPPLGGAAMPRTSRVDRLLVRDQ